MRNSHPQGGEFLQRVKRILIYKSSFKMALSLFGGEHVLSFPGSQLSYGMLHQKNHGI